MDQEVLQEVLHGECGLEGRGPATEGGHEYEPEEENVQLYSRHDRLENW